MMNSYNSVTKDRLSENGQHGDIKKLQMANKELYAKTLVIEEIKSQTVINPLHTH